MKLPTGFVFLLWVLLLIPGNGLPAAKFKEAVGAKRIMVIITGVNEYGEYAENIIKEKLRETGYKLIDPEMMEKVKKDQLLWEAIKNNNATAMAKISTDFGADIVMRGNLTVESHPRFATQWESSASIHVRVIDTKTAEELLSTYSDPLGSTEYPMPVEESALVAKQLASKKVVENIVLKLGLTLSEDVSITTTISPKSYKTFSAKDRIRKVAFTPDSKAIAVMGDHSAEIYEIGSATKIAQYDADDDITSFSFSKNEEFLALGEDSRYVNIYDRRTHKLKHKYKGKSSSVTSVAFNNESSLLAVGFKDGHIEIVDAQKGERVGNLSGHTKKVHSLAFTPNDKLLVSISDDLLTKFWDVNVKRETRSFKEPMDRLFLANLCMDGSLIALNAKEIDIDLLRNRRTDKRFLVVRRTSTGEEIRRFQLPKDIRAIAFYPNKRYVASSSEDDTLRIWDINTGAEVSVLSLKKTAVSLDFSNDGKMLVYAVENVVNVDKL